MPEEIPEYEYRQDKKEIEKLGIGKLNIVEHLLLASAVFLNVFFGSPLDKFY